MQEKIKKLTNTDTFQFLVCSDQVPPVYTCNGHCDWWAKQGGCEERWEDKICFDTLPNENLYSLGKVKDDCKLSCGTCENDRKQHI